MSKLTKNGKNLILENTIVSYSPKDDTIHITSADPDLHGKPFHISLNQSSPTENALRELLVESGIIKEDLIGTNLPEHLTIPETFNEDRNVFDLGVSRQGIVSWEPAKDSHLGIYGHTGSGKTVVANNILLQALSNQDVWDVYCIDLKRTQYFQIKEHLNNPDNCTDGRGGATIIAEKLSNLIKHRLKRMKENNVSNYSDLQKDDTLKPSIIFIDEIAELLTDFLPEASVYLSKFTNDLNEILRKGRAAGVYVVLTSQRPDFFRLNTQVPSSIIMGRIIEDISKVALGSNVAVRTPRVKGRGYFKFGNVEPAQFQAYHSPLSEFDKIGKSS